MGSVLHLDHRRTAVGRTAAVGRTVAAGVSKGKADVILVGVSRTSKTPTCIYLANRGIRAANIPLVPDVDVPEKYLTLEGPLYVGLTESPNHLMQIRKNRLKTGLEPIDNRFEGNAYLSQDAIDEEVRKARKLFSSYGWPVIDVSRRSIEETAAAVLNLYSQHQADKQITQ